ncbi:hypothetical protein Trydic_g19846 [Trypoxylus dichotomus]
MSIRNINCGANIRRIVKSLCFINKCFGLLSYNTLENHEKPEEGTLRFETSYWQLFFAGMVQIAVLVLTIVFYETYFGSLVAVSIMEGIFHFLYVTSQIMLLILTITASKIHNADILRLFDKLVSLADEIITLNPKSEKEYWNIKVMLWIYTAVLLSIIGLNAFAVWPVLTSNAEKRLTLLTALTLAVYSFIFQTLTIMTFSVVYLLLNYCFDSLNIAIEGVVTEGLSESDAVSRLNRTLPIYQNIFQCSRRFNQIYSPQILVQFSLLLTVSVLMLYQMASYLPEDVKERSKLIIYSLALLAFYGYLCSVYVFVAEIFVEQVVAKLKNTLFKLINKAKDEKLRIEVNALALQILHEDHEITAAGFFVVDLRIVTTVSA